MRRVLIRSAAVVLCAIAVGAAGCTTAGSTPSSSSSGQPISGGTATFAENQSSGTISCIVPLESLTCNLPTNGQFIWMQWNPLYWFGKGSQLTMNNQLSLAEPPVYSDGDRVVSVTIKPAARWSNGKPVTARDVEFFVNLARAYGTTWAYSVSGEFPSNVASMTTVGSRTVVFHLTQPYSPTWFTDAQLSLVFALPQQAWDKTSATGPVGNYDLTPAGAQKVIAFLEKQGTLLGSYQSNPLWQVVDGPWRLAAFRTTGYAVLKPNPAYAVGPKPRLSEFVMEPFTSDSAEANELQSGQLSYGYVPVSDLTATSRFASAGYAMDPWPLLSIAYVVLNFTNPTIGPVFRQLYARQAMQALIDVPGYIKAFLGQAGIPDHGPVPLEPPSPYVNATAQSNPNPYDPSKAASLLKSHGWVMSSGVLTCLHPGSSASECGPGVANGTKFQFTIDYVGGVPYLDNEMRAMKSAFGNAEIGLTLTTGTEGQVVGAAAPCTKGASCFQAVQWGTPAWIWTDPYPTGEQLFRTGGGVNPGSFSSPVIDADIMAIEHATSPAAVGAAWSKYSNDVSAQLPDLWIPNTVNQVSAISTKLHGATPQSPLVLLTPSLWYFTK